jgi:hypothetical protein
MPPPWPHHHPAFPMGYFFLASPAFFDGEARHPASRPAAARGVQRQFVMMSIAGVIATLTYALAGHPAFAIALASAALSFGRRGFLRQWDAQQSARDAGDADAVRRLRRLHWAGMLCNAVVLVAFVSSIPYVASI